MDLQTIEMPVTEAREAYEAYRHAVRSAKTAQANSEDAQIARAYKSLAEGKQVLNLDDAFARAGFDKLGYPKLAVSRADQQQVNIRARWEFFEIGPHHLLVNRRANANIDGMVFQVPSGEMRPTVEMRAIVPNIPPGLRPPHGLQNYHLLWEPEWLRIPRPPGDPALLKHLGGPLYAVLAVWDLTPVEQAVLSITRR